VIAVDTSVIVAMALGEPEAEKFQALLAGQATHWLANAA
jgi:uncharacterized protein with PIN domain